MKFRIELLSLSWIFLSITPGTAAVFNCNDSHFVTHRLCQALKAFEHHDPQCRSVESNGTEEINQVCLALETLHSRSSCDTIEMRRTREICIKIERGLQSQTTATSTASKGGIKDDELYLFGVSLRNIPLFHSRSLSLCLEMPKPIISVSELIHSFEAIELAEPRGELKPPHELTLEEKIKNLSTLIVNVLKYYDAKSGKPELTPDLETHLKAYFRDFVTGAEKSESYLDILNSLKIKYGPTLPTQFIPSKLTPEPGGKIRVDYNLVIGQGTDKIVRFSFDFELATKGLSDALLARLTVHPRGSNKNQKKAHLDRIEKEISDQKKMGQKVRTVKIRSSRISEGDLEIVEDLYLGDLTQFHAYTDQLPPAERDKIVLHAAKQVLELVNGLHQNHWVHRDLKPANFLFRWTKAGQLEIVMADFGSALSAEVAGLIHPDKALLLEPTGGRSLTYSGPDLVVNDNDPYYNDNTTPGLDATKITLGHQKRLDSWSTGFVLYALKDPSRVKGCTASPHIQTYEDLCKSCDMFCDAHHQFKKPTDPYDKLVFELMNPNHNERLTVPAAFERISTHN